MIHPREKSTGVPRADAGCDECDRIETVACDYERRCHAFYPNEGQIVRKLQGAGWSFVKGTLRCPACENKRKLIKEPIIMAETVSVTREPTPKQKRLIIMALEDDYDDQAKRYRGNKTDKTLAEELGEGVMFGWVAKIREELFGPEGGNEEIEAIKADIAAARKAFDAQLGAIQKRLDAVCAAVGPRMAK